MEPEFCEADQAVVDMDMVGGGRKNERAVFHVTTRADELPSLCA